MKRQNLSVTALVKELTKLSAVAAMTAATTLSMGTYNGSVSQTGKPNVELGVEFTSTASLEKEVNLIPTPRPKPLTEAKSVNTNFVAAKSGDVQHDMSGNPEGNKHAIPLVQPARYVGHPGEIDGWIAVYFKPEEFASKGNGRINIKSDLVNRLDAVRTEFGQPIKITSGYRDPAHNRRVRGSKNSQHMHGTAVDINMAGMNTKTRYRLMVLLVQNGFTSFGSYDRSPNMLHADLRDRAATWDKGDGIHPDWFTKALRDTGWSRGMKKTRYNINTAGMTSQITSLLDLIATAEGTAHAANYNETLGYGVFTDGPINLTSMTLGEIDRLQTKMLRHPKNKLNSSAVGRYQITRTTLRDLKRNMKLNDRDKFTAMLQDRLAIRLLERRGYKSWRSGRLSDNEFRNNLAKEWASLPNEFGKGHYKGQRARIKSDDIQQTLEAIRKAI